MHSSALYHYLVSVGSPSEPGDDVRFFAACISHKAALRTGSLGSALGLDPAGLRQLLSRFFPEFMAGLDGRACLRTGLHARAQQNFLCECAGGAKIPEAHRPDEWQDLYSLLMASAAAPSGEVAPLMAAVLAQACLGQNHLWQDLGLPGREDLTAALARHFPALCTRNRDNMKWKKFFYRELCSLAEVRVCQAPSCQECTDHHLCFGPEEGDAWNSLAALRSARP